MQLFARKKLAQAIAQIAKGFETSAENLAENFDVTPGVAQKVNEAIRAENTFLKSINVFGVVEVKAEKILVGTTGSLSRRTDTNNKERTARSAHALKARSYELYKTETDVAIRHEVLESWAHIDGGMAKMIRSQVKTQIAEDRVTCGWNGIQADSETDPSTDPLLTKLNIGWPQKLRVENSENVFTEVVANSGKIEIGTSADYANLPALVASLIKVIPKHKRKGLVAYVSDDLADQYEQQIWAMFGEKPTEEDKLKANGLLSRVAKLPMETPDNFPDGMVFITKPKNLSIYWQLSSWKTSSGDNQKAEQWEDLNKRNEGYIIEDVEAAAMAENVSYKAA